MTNTSQRRLFIKQAGITSLGIGFGSQLLYACAPKSTNENQEAVAAPIIAPALFFKISLAQWSLHKSFFGDALNGDWAAFGKALNSGNAAQLLQGNLNPMDFPTIAREKYGIDAIELVNTFYFDRANDAAYWTELQQKATDADVKFQLIMCDALGDLGNTDSDARNTAVENHYKWVDAAKRLGCHSIRVNAAGAGTATEVADAAVDGLGKLTEYGAKESINIIVENHGGYSSDGQWLANVMTQVNSPYCGTLPDFGNFCIRREGAECAESYDRYKGTAELMPFAKGVSAKTHAFDAQGMETSTDYERMLKIVKDAGFSGYIGIEYEGKELSEHEGILATKSLLETVGGKIS
jgi:sugar phosphate isomerase/epimerase